MDPETRQFFAQLARQEGNNKCIDCGNAHPQWASISYGTYFCLQCSGVHRSLGVHISFVRSITMDTWSDKQKKMMELGGNGPFKKFAMEQGIDGMQIRDKYHTVAASYYRNMLKAKHDGTPLPDCPHQGAGASLVSSSQPSRTASACTSSNASTPPQSARGFGNTSYVPPQNVQPYPNTGSTFSSIFDSAKQAASQAASSATTAFNNTKEQAENDGWFDFDNIKANANSWVNTNIHGQPQQGQVYQDPNQQQAWPSPGVGGNHQQSSNAGSGYPSGTSRGTGWSAPLTPAPKALALQHEQRPLATKNKLGAPPSQQGASSSSIAPSGSSKSTIPVTMSPPDVKKNAAKKEKAKADVWDSEAWFDEM